MPTTSDSTTTASTPLTVPRDRLASIAYNCVGIQTEAGAEPYSRIVNAGGLSGLSVGVFQNDFKQNPTTAAPYAQEALDWNAAQGQTASFTQEQFTRALTTGNLSADMRTLARDFGGSAEGATWIHHNIDVPHLNVAVQAAEQLFATPYGQAVLAEGTHVEEVAAYAHGGEANPDAHGEMLVDVGAANESRLQSTGDLGPANLTIRPSAYAHRHIARRRARPYNSTLSAKTRDQAGSGQPMTVQRTARARSFQGAMN